MDFSVAPFLTLWKGAGLGNNKQGGSVVSGGGEGCPGGCSISVTVETLFIFHCTVFKKRIKNTKNLPVSLLGPLNEQGRGLGPGDGVGGGHVTHSLATRRSGRLDSLEVGHRHHGKALEDWPGCPECLWKRWA